MEENTFQQQPAEAVDNGINLLDLWRVLTKYFWRILLLTAIMASIFAAVSHSMVKTVYSATASIIMNPGLIDDSSIDEGADTSASAAQNYSTMNTNYNYYTYSMRFLPSIAKFAKTSQRVKDAVAEKAADQEANPDVERLIGSLSVTYSDNELQLFISYSTTTSAKAAVATVTALANTICEVSQTQENGQYIYLWNRTLHVDDLPKAASSSNNWMLYTGLAFAVIFILWYVYYLIVTITDDTIKSKHEIEEISGFNVMAYVEDIDVERSKKAKQKRKSSAAKSAGN